MNFLNNLLPQAFIHSLGWTIVHSLWQGVIFAIILAIVLFFMKDSTSKSRYIVSVIFSILLITSTVITFINYSGPNEGQNKSKYSIESYKTENLYIDKNVMQESYYSKTKALVEGLLAWSSKYHYYMTALWFAGAMLLLIKFSAGLVFQRHIRNKSFNLNSDFQYIVDNTIRKLSYKGSISVVDSVLSKVPMVIGYFKPIILLPVGILTGLTNEQIELILAHEIAHIIRKDYLVNIFLVITEIVFFYNPAFWWISSRIKFERECCCDDLAISITNYPLTYAKALAAILENNLSVPHYSLALFNKKSHLLKRVERIIKPSAIQPSFREGFVIFLVLVMSMFITITAKVNPSHVTNHSISAIAKNTIKSHDSLKNERAKSKPIHENIKSRSSIDAVKSESSSDEYVVRKFGPGSWDGKGVGTDRGSYKHVTLKWKDNIVTRLSIDEKEINPKDFKNYPDLIYFDEHMPSFDSKLDFDKNKNEGNGVMSAGQLTVGNRTYNNVRLIWKNYTPVYLSVEGKEIDKSDYNKYSDIIDSHVEKKPNINPEIK